MGCCCPKADPTKFHSADDSQTTGEESATRQKGRLFASSTLCSWDVRVHVVGTVQDAKQKFCIWVTEKSSPQRKNSKHVKNLSGQSLLGVNGEVFAQTTKAMNLGKDELEDGGQTFSPKRHETQQYPSLSGLHPTKQLGLFSVKFSFWLPPNKEGDSSFMDRFYRSDAKNKNFANAVVFDVGNIRSYEWAKQWIEKWFENPPKKYPTILVGVITESTKVRQVFPEEARYFARDYNIKYFEMGKSQNKKNPSNNKKSKPSVMEVGSLTNSNEICVCGDDEEEESLSDFVLQSFVASNTTS